MSRLLSDTDLVWVWERMLCFDACSGSSGLESSLYNSDFLCGLSCIEMRSK
jgi:hypothetical protein